MTERATSYAVISPRSSVRLPTAHFHYSSPRSHRLRFISPFPFPRRRHLRVPEFFLT